MPAGAGLVLVVTITMTSLCIYWSVKKREIGRKRAELFRKNGGLLLLQRFTAFTSQGMMDSSARMFSAEELKAATDNYNESRILGRGGHGTVYKGILPDKTVVAIKKSTMFDESQVEQFANEISMDSGKGVRLAKWLFMQLKPDGVVYTTLSHFIQHVGKNILEGLIVMFCQLHGGCNIDPENWLKEWIARTEIHVLFCDMVCVLVELNYDLFVTRDTSIWQVEHHTTKIIVLDPWRNKLQSGEKVMIEIRKGERLQSLGLNGNPVLNKAASSYWIVAIDALYELEIYNSHVARMSLLLGLPLADHAWKQYWNYRVYKCLCRVMFRAYSHTWCLGVVVFDIGQVWGYLICLQLWKLRLNMSIMSLGAHQFSFPLANSWRQVHSKLHGQMQEQASLPDSNSTNLISMFVKSFLASRPMQVAVYHCLHNGLESAIHASLQLISRACLLNASFCVIICGPSNSSSDVNEVEYGGDGTIVSDMCSWLSLCGSYLNKESKQNSNQKCKLSNPHALVVHCCLALVAIAVCLKSEGKSSASYILTISQKKQRSRLSVLAHLSSVDDTVKSCLQPHCVLNMAVAMKEWTMSGAGECKCIAIKKLQVPWDPGGFEHDLEDLTTSAWGQAETEGGENVTDSSVGRVPPRAVAQASRRGIKRSHTLQWKASNQKIEQRALPSSPLLPCCFPIPHSSPSPI